MQDDLGLASWELEYINECVYRLRRTSQEPAADEPLLKQLERNEKGRNDDRIKLASVIKAIGRNGIDTSYKLGHIKALKGEMVEIKVRGTTVRAFSYQRRGEEVIVILGIEEKTHGGKVGGSHNRYMDKYEPLMEIARAKLDEEASNHEPC